MSRSSRLACRNFHLRLWNKSHTIWQQSYFLVARLIGLWHSHNRVPLQWTWNSELPEMHFWKHIKIATFKTPEPMESSHVKGILKEPVVLLPTLLASAKPPTMRHQPRCLPIKIMLYVINSRISSRSTTGRPRKIPIREQSSTNHKYPTTPASVCATRPTCVSQGSP